MYWVNTMVYTKTELYRTNTKGHGLVPAYFALIISIFVHVYSKTSISINKYMQKPEEPENDAKFPKHNYSQLNCSCYSYPSKPRLQCFFRMHIYDISKWLHTTATARVKARARIN